VGGRAVAFGVVAWAVLGLLGGGAERAPGAPSASGGRTALPPAASAPADAEPPHAAATSRGGVTPRATDGDRDTLGGFQPAASCRPCHAAIYDEWRASSMARTVALSAWSLQPTLEVLVATGEGERIRELCYSCHAPFARASGPLELDAPAFHEGVSCDWCHSVREVEASPRLNVAVVEPGDVKTGPHGDAPSPGHGTLALPLMRRSEICAGCHYFAWPGSGMPIDWTYRQWAESPYRAEGVECQTCHMPRQAGRSSTLVGAPDRGGYASHRFPGARDLPTLRSALALRARRERATAVIEIENVGAGHSVPGGGGELRQLELRLVPDPPGRPRALRRYEIRYFDEDGERVSGSDDGAVRFEDTTIRARETRVERVPLPPETGARVELWFWYVSEEVAERDDGVPEGVLVTSVALPAVR
jgi:hypothetical protein